MKDTVASGRRRWACAGAMLLAVGVLGWTARAPVRWHQWQPRLRQAEAESHQTARRVAEALREDLMAHAGGADRFAEQILSWRAKWALLRSQVPGADDAALQDFVRRAFEESVLSGAQIEAGLQRAAVEWTREQQGVENRLLLDLRQDLDLPGPGTVERPAVPGDVASESSDPAAWDSSVFRVIRQDALAQAALLAGTELASMATVQLAVSAGLLGTSGALAPETLGLSLVAGILADLGLTRLYRAVAAPEAAIVAHVRQVVTDVADRVVDGAAGAPGVRARFETLAAEAHGRRRAALRRQLFGW